MLVSIPSERESTCRQMSINNIDLRAYETFQFPPNGKARVDESDARLYRGFRDSFNSLRTGKHV